MFFEGLAAGEGLVESGHVVEAAVFAAAGRRREVVVVVGVRLPIDRGLLLRRWRGDFGGSLSELLLRRQLGLAGLLGRTGIVEHFFEHGVVDQLLRDGVSQLKVVERQKLDRHLELGRHHDAEL